MQGAIFGPACLTLHVVEKIFFPICVSKRGASCEVCGFKGSRVNGVGAHPLKKSLEREQQKSRDAAMPPQQDLHTQNFQAGFHGLCLILPCKKQRHGRHLLVCCHCAAADSVSGRDAGFLLSEGLRPWRLRMLLKNQ
eukprot:3776167-Rhodomonas_salina.1